MNHSSKSLDWRLWEKLQAFKDVPERGPQAAAQGRASFLEQAKSLSANPTGSVSDSAERRLNRWIDPILNIFNQKERTPMLAPFVSMLIVLSMLVGGGATVYAAQDSLPGQALYSVKLTSEDLRLDLANTSTKKVSLELAFAYRRIEELRRIIESGDVPPEALLARLQMHLDQSLILAAGLEDDSLTRALEQIRKELQIQAQLLEAAGPEAQLTPLAEAVRIQARTLVQEHLNATETGLRDRQAFRQQWHQRQSQSPIEPTSAQQRGFGPGPQNTQMPGNGAGPGSLATCTCTPTGSGNDLRPFVTGTPTPGSGYGPGPGPFITGTPTPGSGYGPGPGSSISDASTTPKSGFGPGPGSQVTQDNKSEPVRQVTNTPGDKGKNGSGPGPEPGSTCTPQSGPGPQPVEGARENGGGGDGANNSGPQPTSQPGNGGPGGKGRP